MRYEKRWFCIGCNNGLSYEEKMNSHGCCPYCGHLTGGTICDTVERSVPVKPWMDRMMDCIEKWTRRI